MPAKPRADWLALGAVVVVVAAFIYVHLRAHLRYGGLELGMTRAAVIAHLGQPRRIDSSLLFCAPYVDWSGQCPPTRAGAQFLHYKFGIDRWIIVGIDETQRVWFLTIGDV